MKSVAKENLYQLKDLLQNISKAHYTEKPEVLSGASIGQHIRHILEFYLLLISGSFSGTIDYDRRKRDSNIENDPEVAIKTIHVILKGMDTLNENLEVIFESDYSVNGESQKHITSSAGRELAYCIEHSIHHQALIKAALIAMGLKELSNKNFGVAYSTIQYRDNTCAQ
jgi:uncharacterized damage-inducible protein DinB